MNDETRPTCRVSEDFEDRFDDALDACASNLISLGCPTPFVENEEIAGREEDWEELRSFCGEELSGRLRLDCSAIPCLVVAPEEDYDEAMVCLKGHLQIDPVAAVGGWRPVSWLADPAFNSIQILEYIVKEREAQRVRRLFRSLERRGEVTSMLSKAISCEGIERFQEPEHTCDVVRQTIGCEPDPERMIPQEEVEAYIAEMTELVEAQADRCPAFAESDWRLDCSDLPCFLVIGSIPKGLPFSSDYVKSLSCGYYWTQPLNWNVQDILHSDFAVAQLRLQEGWYDHEGINQRLESHSSARFIRGLSIGSDYPTMYRLPKK